MTWDKPAPPGGPARRPECDRAISLARAAGFVLALRDGATVAGAARVAGVAVQTLYHRRRIDADFAACWARAGASADAAAARAAARAADDAAQGMAVREHATRWLVRKRLRAVEFTRARKQAFLDRFADGCNMAAAAAAAGVTDWTVRRALARDAAFAAGFEEALAIGYDHAETECLRQALTAQEAYYVRPTEEGGALAFDQALAVLREYKRGHGRIGRRPYAQRPILLSHEEGFLALEREPDRLGRREALRARPAAAAAQRPPPSNTSARCAAR
ncbi:MAG TPA: hypothetical protein VMG08_02415 [Allosphingosinicella sp.]|nr:hypothetical protein [Allosphingosinicella sp.]